MPDPCDHPTWKGVTTYALRYKVCLDCGARFDREPTGHSHEHQHPPREPVEEEPAHGRNQGA